MIFLGVLLLNNVSDGWEKNYVSRQEKGKCFSRNWEKRTGSKFPLNIAYKAFAEHLSLFSFFEEETMSEQPDIIYTIKDIIFGGADDTL